MDKRNWILLPLLILGLLISGYLSFSKLIGTATACFGGAGSCELVQNSAYAFILGIPVAYLGFLTYVALFILWIVKIRDWQEWGLLAAQLFLGVALLGAIFAAYLTYVELAILKDICQWCVASAIVNWLLLATTLIGLSDELS
ncbi:MAG: vitamin K epoxide reductase family protein [Chloroflexota bacterium]